MKKISIVLLVVIMAVSLAACGRNTGTSSDQQNSNEEQLTGKHHVVIAVKDYGNISVELDADAAPITVTNFVTLAKSGFYDGLTFHRIISGFMIQGGDPLGDGTGGSDTKIKGEFSDNGVSNKLTHKRGAISMARCSISRTTLSTSPFTLLYIGAISGVCVCSISEGTFSQSWAEKIFFDIIFVFRVNICLWVVWKEA